MSTAAHECLFCKIVAGELPANRLYEDDELLAFRETVGDFGTLLYAGHDWADARLARRSMELMAEKVMPALNDAIESSPRVAAGSPD